MSPLQSSGPTATRELCRGFLLEVRRFLEEVFRENLLSRTGAGWDEPGAGRVGVCRMLGHHWTLQHPMQEQGVFPSPFACSTTFHYPG